MSESFVERVNIDISADVNPNSHVNTPNASYEYMMRYWSLIDIVGDGFESVKTQAGSVILPIYGEGVEPYQSRLKHLDFLPLFSRLVNLSASMICRKAVSVVNDDDAPEGIVEKFKEHLENIDSMGNSIDVVLETFLNLQIKYSIAGILVDAPVIPDGGLSLADEIALDVRPYWVVVSPKDVIDWRCERRGAKQVLTHLRLRSTTDIVIDEFKSKSIPIVKVYDLKDGAVLVRTFIQSKDKEQKTSWVEDPAKRVRMGLPYIPYFAMNTNSVGPYCARPTLYELAVVNINHTRVASDLLFALNLAAHPKLKRTRSVEFQPSFDETPAPDMAPDKLLTPGVGEDYEWLSAPDTAFSALERRIEKYEQDAEKLWTMAIMPHKNVAESEASKKMSQNQSSSVLLKTVIALDSLLAQCVQAYFDLMDRSQIGECPPVSINVNRDLDTTGMGFDLLNVLREMVLSHQLSVKCLLELMVRGQILPEDFDVESELEELMKDDSGELPELPADLTKPEPVPALS
jgi:hypothetical protein